jgi:hypothetical protein
MNSSQKLWPLDHEAGRNPISYRPYFAENSFLWIFLYTKICSSMCTHSRIYHVTSVPVFIYLSHCPACVTLQWRRNVSILPRTPDFADCVSCFLFFHIQPWVRVSCTIRQTAPVNLPTDIPVSQLNFKFLSMNLLALNNVKRYSRWVEWRVINFNTSKTIEPAAISTIA